MARVAGSLPVSGCSRASLYAPETVLRQRFSTLWSSTPSPFQKNGVEGGAHQAGQPVVIARLTTAV
jgi:hypothetical protein